MSSREKSHIEHADQVKRDVFSKTFARIENCILYRRQAKITHLSNSNLK